VPQPDHVAHNRNFWDADADAYQAAHGTDLAHRAEAWGSFRRPEAELDVLGDVAGRAVLELGCGAAQWSAALTRRGARVTGLDLSAVQLRHARDHCANENAPVALVLASAEQVPFAPASFDTVFCDHGAMSFCDPQKTVPEVARVLRPGGLFAFCATHPLVYLTWNREKERQARRLHLDYDALGRMDFDDGTIDWVLPPGAWIRLFRGHGFEVEDLIELRARADASTTYTDFVPPAWAQRWPAEQIWKVRLAR
jgi:SAM-dependent methyltransferase